MLTASPVALTTRCGAAARCSRPRRVFTTSRQGPQAPWRTAATPSDDAGVNSYDDEAASRGYQSDEQTDAWNAEHLSMLQKRIEEIKRASTVHFLEHGYQRGSLESVTPDLATRPALPPITGSGDQDWAHHHKAASEICNWHGDQWQKLYGAVNGEYSD